MEEDQPLCEIVFRGDLKTGYSPEQVRHLLSTKLNIPEGNLAGLFTGKPVIVKKGITRAKAESIQNRFGVCGAIVQIRHQSDRKDNLQAAERKQLSKATTISESNNFGLTLIPQEVKNSKDQSLNEKTEEDTPKKGIPSTSNAYITTDHIYALIYLILSCYLLYLYHPFPEIEIKRGLILSLFLLFLCVKKLLLIIRLPT